MFQAGTSTKRASGHKYDVCMKGNHAEYAQREATMPNDISRQCTLLAGNTQHLLGVLLQSEVLGSILSLDPGHDFLGATSHAPRGQQRPCPVGISPRIGVLPCASKDTIHRTATIRCGPRTCQQSHAISKSMQMVHLTPVMHHDVAVNLQSEYCSICGIPASST
jgi:hypothetical protein